MSPPASTVTVLGRAWWGRRPAPSPPSGRSVSRQSRPLQDAFVATYRSASDATLRRTLLPAPWLPAPAGDDRHMSSTCRVRGNCC